MGLKETWQNLDKNNALKVALLVLILIATSVSAYETCQVRKLLGGESTAPVAREAKAPSAQAPSKKPSDYKFGMEYNKALKSKKPMFLLFYADWCGFCVRFMPIYESLYKKYKNQFNFVKINVEDSKYEDAVRKYEIEAFPTLFLVNPKKDTHEQVQNANFGDDQKMKEIIDTFYSENK